MRHFAEVLRKKKIVVDYRQIGMHKSASLVEVLASAVKQYAPEKVVMVEPGDWRRTVPQPNPAVQSPGGSDLAARRKDRYGARAAS